MDSLVSIIIPAYNKAELTVKAVKSVLDQTYSNVELIVVDDGSTDNTKEKMFKFGNQIQYIHKDNGGCCSARNKGIELAKGDYFAFLDCDDTYEPDKIKMCVQFLQNNKEYGAVHTAANFIDEKGNTLRIYSHLRSQKTGWISNVLILKNYICNSTPVMRRECINKVGNFDESIFTPADWDLMIRISEKYRVGYIDEPLTRYLVSGNYVFEHLGMSLKEELQVLKKTFSRSNRYNSWLRRCAISDLHLRYAQAYILKNDTIKIREEFINSIKGCFLNYQTWGMLIYFIFARENLRRQLHEKILRLI